ncbi:M12 family metallopeptidase [Sorangium sp. So ce281]|uniref:M12 family metallopeptidase n=1 Tax=unclassified Sorangium TaxID=2621164 RepID=UPI003F610FD8
MSAELNIKRQGESRSLLVNGKNGPEELNYDVVDGRAIYQGDIVPGTVEEFESRPKGSGVTIRDYRWPNRTIPFLIDGDVPTEMRTKIDDAIAHWETNTDFDFVARTTQSDYVEFVLSNECTSPAGRQGGRQTINVSPQVGSRRPPGADVLRAAAGLHDRERPRHRHRGDDGPRLRLVLERERGSSSRGGQFRRSARKGGRASGSAGTPACARTRSARSARRWPLAPPTAASPIAATAAARQASGGRAAWIAGSRRPVTGCARPSGTEREDSAIAAAVLPIRTAWRGNASDRPRSFRTRASRPEPRPATTADVRSAARHAARRAVSSW